MEYCFTYDGAIAWYREVVLPNGQAATDGTILLFVEGEARFLGYRLGPLTEMEMKLNLRVVTDRERGSGSIPVGMPKR